MSICEAGDRVRLIGGPLAGQRACITGMTINAEGFFYTIELENDRYQGCPHISPEHLEKIDAEMDITPRTAATGGTGMAGPAPDHALDQHTAEHPPSKSAPPVAPVAVATIETLTALDRQLAGCLAAGLTVVFLRTLRGEVECLAGQFHGLGVDPAGALADAVRSGAHYQLT